jgi:hypothetical protein
VVVFTPNYFDVEGLPSAEISGTRETAFVATGGKIIKELFDASVFGEPIALVDDEGNPVFVAAGKTFVLLPPGAGSQAGGVTPGSVSYGPKGSEVTRTI